MSADELRPEVALARFEQARQRGFPAWLWPDIEVGAWRAGLDDIARVTRRILAGETGVPLRSTDAIAMGVAGYTSGMGPLLGYWIENGALEAPKAVAAALQLHLVHNRVRMSRLADTAREILGALAESGISPLVLKGMHTAFCHFPEAGVRSLSDIDVYIPGSSMPEAERTLSHMGLDRTLRTRSPYACDWAPSSQRPEPRTLRFVHQDDPWSFDVQASLDRRLMTGAKIRLDRLLTRDVRSKWPPSSAIGVLPQPLLTLYLATHISQMMLNATLIRLVELVLVIRHDVTTAKLDWGEFLEGAVAMGGPRFVYPAVFLCEQLAPGTIPANVVAVARGDAPQNLRNVVDRLTVASAQPLDRHSVSERFMWAETWPQRLRQVVAEIAFDGRGRPLNQVLYSAGTKLWALRQRRYSA